MTIQSRDGSGADQFCRVTNGPTEAANNLAKLIKRVSFGITSNDHYRTRVLLYAGKPDWTLLDDLTPRQNAKIRQCRGGAELEKRTSA